MMKVLTVFTAQNRNLIFSSLSSHYCTVLYCKCIHCKGQVKACNYFGQLTTVCVVIICKIQVLELKKGAVHGEKKLLDHLFPHKIHFLTLRCSSWLCPLFTHHDKKCQIAWTYWRLLTYSVLHSFSCRNCLHPQRQWHKLKHVTFFLRHIWFCPCDCSRALSLSLSCALLPIGFHYSLARAAGGKRGSSSYWQEISVETLHDEG